MAPGLPGGIQAQGKRRRPMQAWVPCSGDRTTACDPPALGGWRLLPDHKQSTTTTVPVVMMFDVPVPLMAEQLPDILQFFATFLSVVAEQVIDVPKIIFENIPTRIPLREPQLVEQLVEVPTVPFYVEQVVDNLDHQGSLPEQGPTLGLRLRGGLQGFLTGQGSTALLDAPQEHFRLFFSHFSPTQKKCQGLRALQCGAGCALDLVHAERSTNGSPRCR